METCVDTQRITLDRSWWSFAGPHGGYLASQLLLAVTRLTDKTPRSMNAQFIAAAREGAADIVAATDRHGRTATFASATLASAGTLTARAAVVLGDARAGPVVAAPPMPHVEAPEQLAALDMPPEFVPFAQHLEFRPPPGGMAFGGERPEATAWIRFRSGRPMDAVAACVLADATPPALYATLPGPVPVPTADLSVQFAPHAAAADDWALVRIETRSAADGWCIDDSTVWSRDGHLVATARQTRLVLSSDR